MDNLNDFGYFFYFSTVKSLQKMTTLLQFELLILCMWRCQNMYLPGLDSDTSHCAVQIDIPYSYVGNTCFAVISSQATNTDSMARPTGHTVDVNV